MIKRQPANMLRLLTKDHWNIKRLFDEFEDAAPGAVRALGSETLEALKEHSRIEEEFLHPALAKAGIAVRREAEQASKALIEELESLGGDDGAYTGKFLSMASGTLDRIRDEEERVFPEARKARVDLRGLGLLLLARRASRLAGEHSLRPEPS